jgi:hypothetical protein
VATEVLLPSVVAVCILRAYLSPVLDVAVVASSLFAYLTHLFLMRGGIFRSKFCKHTGCVIARMDHHCAWLNMTIGHKNHRTFVVFLQLHLYLCLASVVMLVR